MTGSRRAIPLGTDFDRTVYLGKVEPGKYDLILKDALVSESAEAVGTDHGFTSPNGCAIRFTGTPKANPMTFSGKIYDSCGLGWEPDGANATMVLSRGVSTTTGAVDVAKGTLRLTDGATFTQLKTLRIGTNATFEVTSGAGANFKVGSLTRTDASSRLTLGAGVAFEIGSLTLPDGSALPRGIYGATAVNGSVAVDWIEGDGFIGVGGAYPKRSAAEYLTADGWYEFGDPNWVYSSTISTTPKRSNARSAVSCRLSRRRRKRSTAPFTSPQWESARSKPRRRRSPNRKTRKTAPGQIGSSGTSRRWKTYSRKRQPQPG